MTANRVAAALLSLYAALAVFAAWTVGPTADERLYLNTGRELVRELDWTGDNRRFQPPLGLYTNQVLNLHVPDAEFAEPELGRRLTLGRLGMLPWGLLAGWLVFVWARRAFGERGALLALLLYATNPMTIGYAALVPVDVAHMATTALACVALDRWIERRTLPRLYAFGLALGAMLATKYIALTLAPALALGAAAVAALAPRGRPPLARAGAALGTLAFVTATVVLTLHAAYLFQVGFGPSDPADYRSPLLARLTAFPGLGPLASTLPAAWIEGVDMQLAYDAGTGSRTYLAGAFREDPPGYYAVAFLTKTPELALLALAAALLVLPRALAGRGGARRASACWIALLGFAIPFAVLSLATSYKVGLRYALQLFPMLFVLAGATAELPLLRAPRRAQASFGMAGLLALATVLPHAANPIAYYNAASGGPAAGYRWFADSNSDWNQLGRDADVELPPDAYRLVEGEGPRLGRVAVYLLDLVFRDRDEPSRPGSWLWRFEPSGSIGAAWWLFDVDEGAWRAAIDAAPEEERAAVRAELALALLAEGRVEDASRELELLPAELARPLAALLDHREAHAADPSAPKPRLALASAWLRQRRPDLAETLLLDAELPDTDASALLVATALMNRRRLEEAILYLESLGELDGKPLATLTLASLYARRWRDEEALALIERYGDALRAVAPDQVDEVVRLATKHASGRPDWLRERREP